MYDQISLVCIIFLSILRWVIILDIILSWSVLFGVRVQIPFVRSLLDPVYRFVRSNLPTTFSGLDFAPLIVLLGIYFLEGVVLSLNPGVTVYF
jgi:YggT family protein